MSEEKQCVLVIVGADEYGRKELLAMSGRFSLSIDRSQLSRGSLS